MNLVASTGLRDAKVRYWVSAGPGNFGILPVAGASTCTKSFRLHHRDLEAEPGHLLRRSGRGTRQHHSEANREALQAGVVDSGA